MIKRKNEVLTILNYFKFNPVVGLIGARQVGKTTIARMVSSEWKGKVTYFDVENPEDQSRLADPMLALKTLTGLVIIDEVQRAPGIFNVLRVLADRQNNKTKFLILGSASPELLKQGSESLAGRIIYFEIGGFRINDINSCNTEQLWLRGGLPKSYLARNNKESFEWRRNYISTFLERDIHQLGININSVTLRRFWTMLAHYHGQIWNSSEFARSFGVADTTVRGYLDKLTAALVIRQLLPWYENISKRQIKMPKIYISDSGILHTLLNLKDKHDVESYPKLGASWEGFLLDQVIYQAGADKTECYFWATHAGAELDLLIVKGRKRFGFEFKRTSSPKITSSMISARTDLKINQLSVIFHGNTSFPLGDGIMAIGSENITKDIKPV